MNITQQIDAFECWWLFALLGLWDYQEQCCRQCSCKCLSVKNTYGIYWGVELQCQSIYVRWALVDIVSILKWLYQHILSTENYESFHCSMLPQQMLFLVFFWIADCGILYCFLEICMCLMIDELKTVSNVYWTFGS